jgi:type IV pilus assembly protein PilW
LPEPDKCGEGWALNLALTVDGVNNGYNLACGAQPAAQADSDMITIRRATVEPVPLEAGRLQIQTTRIQGAVFSDGAIPVPFSAADSTTHNLLVNTYYVADNSPLIPGTPTLRRKTLTVTAGAPDIVDTEIAPGVESLQIQFGVDVNEDNTVDRYVNPGDDVYNPAAAGYIPGAKVMTARIWLVVRGLNPEVGIVDNRDYEPGDIDLGVINDGYRRMQVSKTILLRNART